MEDLSTKFVEFATLNSTDVSTSVDNVSSVLNAFGQSSDDAGNLLDALNQVGQATGVSMDTLSQDLAKFEKGSGEGSTGSDHRWESGVHGYQQ